MANNQYIEMREVEVSHDGESFGMQPGKPLVLRCAASPCCGPARSLHPPRGCCHAGPCPACHYPPSPACPRARLPSPACPRPPKPARCLRYKNPNYWYHESYFGTWCKAPIDKHFDEQFKAGLLARAKADKLAADAANAAAQAATAS